MSLGEIRRCHCGKRFPATRENRRSCSLVCKTRRLTRAYRARLRAAKPRVRCALLGCGSFVPRGRRVYCSRRCRMTGSKRVERALRRARGAA